MAKCLDVCYIFVGNKQFCFEGLFTRVKKVKLAIVQILIFFYVGKSALPELLR